MVAYIIGHIKVEKGLWKKTAENYFTIEFRHRRKPGLLRSRKRNTFPKKPLRTLLLAYCKNWKFRRVHSAWYLCSSFHPKVPRRRININSQILSVWVALGVCKLRLEVRITPSFHFTLFQDKNTFYFSIQSLSMNTKIKHTHEAQISSPPFLTQNPFTVLDWKQIVSEISEGD